MHSHRTRLVCGAWLPAAEPTGGWLCSIQVVATRTGVGPTGTGRRRRCSSTSGQIADLASCTNQVAAAELRPAAAELHPVPKPGAGPTGTGRRPHCSSTFGQIADLASCTNQVAAAAQRAFSIAGRPAPSTKPPAMASAPQPPGRGMRAPRNAWIGQRRKILARPNFEPTFSWVWGDLENVS